METVRYTKISISETEVLIQEKKLLAKGYKMTRETDPDQLKPYEYYKQRLGGSNVSQFRGPVEYEIVWCSPR